MVICVSVSKSSDKKISIPDGAYERIISWVNDMKRVATYDDENTIVECYNLLRIKISTYMLSMYDLGVLRYADMVDLRWHYISDLIVIRDRALEARAYQN